MAEINQQLSRLLSAWCELRLMYREASVSRSYRRSAPPSALSIRARARGRTRGSGGVRCCRLLAGVSSSSAAAEKPRVTPGNYVTKRRRRRRRRRHALELDRRPTRTDHGMHATCVDLQGPRTLSRRRPRPHRTGRVSYSRRDVIAVRRSTISLSSVTISRSWLATLCLAADQLQPSRDLTVSLLTPLVTDRIYKLSYDLFIARSFPVRKRTGTLRIWRAREREPIWGSGGGAPAGSRGTRHFTPEESKFVTLNTRSHGSV